MLIWSLSYAYQLYSTGQDQICDEAIEKQLKDQNIDCVCNSTTGVINIDGKKQNKTLSLNLQNLTIMANGIEIFDFDYLIFSSLVFDRTDGINNQFMIIIYGNNVVQIEEFKVLVQKESFINYTAIYKNNNVILNDIQIIFSNGYTPKTQLKFFSIPIFLLNNLNTSINNYNFFYRQSNKDLNEYLSIYGLLVKDDYVRSNITIETVNLQIDFTINQLKGPTSFSIFPLQIYPGQNIVISKLNIKLNSLPNTYMFYQSNALIFFDIARSLKLGNINIQNKDFFINILKFNTIQDLQIDRIDLRNIFLQRIPSIGSYQQMISIIQFVTNNVKSLTSIFIEDCNVQQQYLALNYQSENYFADTTSINYFNSTWKDTMVYINDMYNNNLHYFFLSIKKCNFNGFNSLIRVVLTSFKQATFQIDLETADQISLTNGLIQVQSKSKLSQKVAIQNSRIIVKDNTIINLGKGGLLQFISQNILVISNTIIISENQQIANAQYGGIFQMINIISVSMINVTASGFKINGQGSFAFIQAAYLTLQGSLFDRFYSQGSGGAIFCAYQTQILIQNTTISNSQSSMFGGAVYFQKNNPSPNQLDRFDQFNVINNTAQVGGGITYNSYYDQLSSLNFINNSAELGNDTFLPVTGVNILSYGQYNPTLTEQLINKPLNYTFYNISQNNILNLNSTQIYMIYYVTLKLNLGNISIGFNDLKCQSSICQNNLINQLFSISPQASQQNPNQIQYQYSIQDFNNNLLDNTYNYTSDFYFLFQQTKDFTYLQQKYQLQGATITLQLQKQQLCNEGQIRVNANGISYCKYCNNFQASLNPNSTECYKCSSEQFQYCSGYIQDLKSGYYRVQKSKNSKILQNQQTQDQNLGFASKMVIDQNLNKFQSIEYYYDQQQQQEDDQTILRCSLFPSNCEGGTSYGDAQCAKSHVGPLCQECDRRNSSMNGYYTRQNSYICSECNSYLSNKVKFILFCFGAVLVIAVFDLVLYLAYQGIIKNKDIKDRVCIGVHLKYLFFFNQIINVCSFYQSPSIIISLFTFQVYFYNPIQNSGFNFFECFLIQAFPNFFSIPYLQIFFETLFPIFMIGIYLILRFLTIKLVLCCKNREGNATTEQDKQNDKGIEKTLNEQNEVNEQSSYKMNYVTNKIFIIQLILFSLYTLSFQVIQTLLSGLFCQSFESIGSFSSIDLTIECYNESRLYMFFFIIFFLILYGLVLPGYLFYSLFKNRDRLENEEIKFVYGFLHTELKRNCYYWECVRYIFKLLIVIAIQLTIPNNYNIGIYVIFILSVYLGLLICIQPYVIDREYYQKTNSRNKFVVGHTNREVTLIFSGIIMILFYLINATSSANKYSSLDSSSSQALAIIGNTQALIILIAIIYKLARYIYLSVKSFYNRNGNDEQQQLNSIHQINQDQDNNSQVEDNQE